ncbi:TPA: hypothetical protein NOE69_000773 [Pseudomonas aeruginosa]|nr:hypothetical protein [Pseudomonas aeruginosa]HCI2310343.1 hypothetical protein [Pseudomonas aeruginosa]
MSNAESSAKDAPRPQRVNSLVRLPGGLRTNLHDGSYLCLGTQGERFHVSSSGEIDGSVPSIRRVRIQDLGRVVSHEIVALYDTISHTVQFAGGAVLGYVHLRDGRGMELHGKNIMFEFLPDDVVVVHDQPLVQR